MRRVVFFAMALAAASLGAPDGRAQEAVPEHELLRTEGEVTKVDWVANAVAVSGLDGEIVFDLTPKTVVLAQTEQVFLTELREGQHVEVYYFNKPDGASEAVRIVIITPVL